MSASTTPDIVPLCAANLPRVTTEIAIPRYNRSDLLPSIVHIGFGNFHRSHLAMYIDELLRTGEKRWAIAGCGILPQDRRMADVMAAQDNLYTLVTPGKGAPAPRVIGSVVRYIYAYPDASELINTVASRDTQILSLTLTEGGYPVDEGTGEFDASSALATPAAAFGLLVRALDKRRRDNAGPITVLSCDNVVGNGDVAKSATLGMARLMEDDGELVDWINSGNVTFPNSMVDRITPVTTDSERRWMDETFQLTDGWPVFAEPFCQWVVEDNFAGARLPLESMNVLVTHDVTGYEQMKLRLLNAGHCCVAYAAALLGISLVHEAMADSDLFQFLATFLRQEAGPAINPVPKNMDVEEYIASLLERFSNPHIRDQIARLCLQGYAKLPKFLLPTIRSRLDSGKSVDISTLLLATWCEYLLGKSESGGIIPLPDDPAQSVAISYAQASRDSPSAFLEFSEVFGDALPHEKIFTDSFRRSLRLVRRNGVRAAIRTRVGDVLCTGPS